MDAGWAMVVAAVVAAVGAILVALLDRFRKENSRDHEVVLGMLKIMHKSQARTEEKVDHVGERLADHLKFHAEKEGAKRGKRFNQAGNAKNTRISK